MTAVRVCSFEELADGAPVRVEIDDVAVCVVRIGDEIHAIGDTCSHAEVSLSEGDVYREEREIECPKHGSSFSLVTGDALTLPAVRPVPVFAARREGDDVIVEVGGRE